ncbi:MAG: hypothetical protein BroJett006_11490 [Betaproteobacteria bacterium]|jgi:Cytochrome C'.|nr:MAG: hypothetical protein BroJett006_11490 [Betaproteobacteria bacterium]
MNEAHMKKLLFTAMLIALPAAAEDTRQLARLTPQAQEVLRQEMLDNLIAVNEILSLVAANKLKEAGEVAETKLGKSAMGKNARLPFEQRPGPQMPAAMHELGRNGHLAASEFAAAAASGERERALALLPKLTENCVACHASYRTR